MDLRAVLEKVARGELDPSRAAELLRSAPDVHLGYACVDTDRQRRRGLPEVIYCPGKTAKQIIGIIRALHRSRQNILATRISPEQAGAVRRAFPHAVFHATPRALTLDVTPLPPPTGLVVIVTAGTTDIPVAEEAALVAARMGARVERLYDVGVAGLHRILQHVDLLRRARAVVVVAGFEGALPSVVGGLTDRPVFAVPSSTGYGTALHGLAALVAMLNSCVPGIAVLNVDNGFGAGVAAALVNRVAEHAAAPNAPARGARLRSSSPRRPGSRRTPTA